MPQQINLYSPILLAPRRYFSAQAVVQALAVFALGLGAMGLWSEAKTRELRQATASTRSGLLAERQRIEKDLAQQPAAASVSALEQELEQARRGLSERQALLQELGGQAQRAAPTAVLRLLAQTTPAPVWLTDVRLAQGRVELAGMTLKPEALRPWVAQLEADARLAGLSLSAVKVEHAPASAGAPTWTFRITHGHAPAAAAGPK